MYVIQRYYADEIGWEDLASALLPDQAETLFQEAAEEFGSVRLVKVTNHKTVSYIEDWNGWTGEIQVLKEA